MINLFYKPYLYYNLFIRHKIQNKRLTYSQFQVGDTAALPFTMLVARCSIVAVFHCSVYHNMCP